IVLLRPARVLVLLGILGGLLLPSLRRLAGLDRLVLLLRVALPGHRHNRGVNNLAAARNIALSLKMLPEALKQLVDQRRLRQAPEWYRRWRKKHTIRLCQPLRLAADFSRSKFRVGICVLCRVDVASKGQSQ